ncbi:hypothetical protein MLD38_039564 [Melastoma candidum]|uniref:Uncharacterized protein n=1 Tax=Melastoma candidum TaxID=119954 RepID=A0ACB9L2W8_9MYRT|nr:hypothetical protein MLD38_039564 [Melastoma candidum]
MLVRGVSSFSLQWGISWGKDMTAAVVVSAVMMMVVVVVVVMVLRFFRSLPFLRVRRLLLRHGSKGRRWWESVAWHMGEGVAFGGIRIAGEGWEGEGEYAEEEEEVVGGRHGH